MRKQLIQTGMVAFVVSALTFTGFQYFTGDREQTVRIEHHNSTPAQSASYNGNEGYAGINFDFSATAEKVVNAVVHIKSTQTAEVNQNERNIPDPFRDFFDDFFSPRFRDQQPMNPTPQVGTGSGVIISTDGYIVTNNHVIDNASDIEVTLHDNRTFKATVIGTDPTTDLALIQIKATELPKLAFVNSDEVKIGEWVLAVGNPFSLNSTVTAGIVSAKARNINILRDQYAVESFIQTDAAINPGNSGGALVNINGGLVGINTAIASPTGSYSGYGFAVPSNIVNKVVEDLLEYGVVQRGVLGILIRSVDGNFAKEKDLSVNAGVYVDSIMSNSAAGEAGLASGDVIVGIDNIAVDGTSMLQEIVARRRPGDRLNILVNRKGKEKSFDVTLKNRSGNTEYVTREDKPLFDILGAELEVLDAAVAKKLDIDGGVRITKLYPGKLRQQTQVREGFIITKIDGKKVTSIEDVSDLLENKTGGVLMEGVYEDLPGAYYYGFGL